MDAIRLLQIRGARRILRRTLVLIVLGAIQFHCQLCLCAVKIQDIPAKDHLPPELDRVYFQKIIP